MKIKLEIEIDTKDDEREILEIMDLIETIKTCIEGINNNDET